MDVDAADVLIEPLIDNIHQSPGLSTIIAVRGMALLKPGQGLDEILVRRLVNPGHRAAVLRHALLLETKVSTAIKHQVIEQHGVHLVTQAIIESGTKILGHLENHPVILVNLLETSRVTFAPFHLCSLNFAQPDSRLQTLTEL